MIFDATFGVVAPLLCLIFDPIVFHGGFIGPPLYGQFRIYAYVTIFIEITALLVWLVGGRTPQRARVLGGVLLAGALFSLVVGLALLPYSLIGLLFAGLGLLGFMPFLTAFLYLRNGRRALKYAQTNTPAPGRNMTPVLLSALLTLIVPVGTQRQVTRLVTRETRGLTEGPAAAAPAATRRLKYVRWVAGEEYDELVFAYGREPDTARKARLASAYKELTGADVEARLARLND